jgi:hypothetical protein
MMILGGCESGCSLPPVRLKVFSLLIGINGGIGEY